MDPSTSYAREGSISLDEAELISGTSTPINKGINNQLGYKNTLCGIDEESPGLMAASKANNDILDKFLKYDLTQSTYTKTIDQFLNSLMKVVRGEPGQPVRPYGRLPRDRHLMEIVQEEEVLRYRREYCKPVQKEGDRYSPFCFLANTILEKISGPDSPSICFVRNDPHVLACDDHPSGRKPDLVYVRSDNCAVRDGKWKSHCLDGPNLRGELWKWTDVLGVGEVKITSKGSIVLEEDIPRPSTSLDLPFNHSGPVTRGIKKKFEEAMSTTNKRQRTRSGASSSGFSPLQYYELPDGPTRRRNPKLREDLVYQSARYVSDHMTMDVTRRHVLNLLISDGFLWLAYYDHQGVIYSPPLNFVDDLYRLAYVLKVLNDFEGGYLGHFGQFETVESTCLIGSRTGERDELGCSKTVNVLRNIGRGYPIDLSFVTGKRIFEGHNRIFFGESTQMVMVGTKIEDGIIVPMTVSDLDRTDACEDSFMWKHVLKWSYPRPSRISEPELIKAAKRVLERHDNNPDPSGKALTVKISNSLPDVLNGYDIDEREKNFRAFLGVEYEEQRILRFAMLEYLEPIHSLPDLTQFKGAVRQIALAIHYLASSEEGIKHRDINVNNLMFRRLSDGQIQGVLCDWDQASTYETEKSKDHTGMRNGTRTFLSIDMHKNPPPVHIERFDFESLLYVMYWISKNHSGGKPFSESEKQKVANGEWKFWNVEEDDPLNAMKRYFLNRNISLCNSPESFTPFFMPLVSSWLDPLRRQFREGYNLRDAYEDPIESPLLASTTNAESNQGSALETIPSRFDNATLGGKVCFQKIWAILEK